MNWSARILRHARVFLMVSCITVIGTAGARIAGAAGPWSWVASPVGQWTDEVNWQDINTQNPLDALQPDGDMYLTAVSTALNNCVLEATGLTADVSGYQVTVEGHSSATSANQRLHIQNNTRLLADLVLVLPRARVIVDGQSVLESQDYIVVDTDAELYLRDSSTDCTNLANWGLVHSEFDSDFVLSGAFDNYGTLNIECGADLWIHDGSFQLSGAREVNNYLGAEVIVRDGATIHVGSIDNQGGVTLGGGCNPTQVAHLIGFGPAVWDDPDADFFLLPNGVLTCSGFACAVVDPRFAAPGSIGNGTLELDGEIQLATDVPLPTLTMEMIGQNLGPDVDLGSDPTHVIETLRFGPSPSPITLVDESDNTGYGVPETIYVRDLILEDGITLDLNGGTIYYGTVTPEDPYSAGSGVTIIGPGSLEQVTGTTGIANMWSPGDARARLELHGAAPNPFNPQTTIRFETAGRAHVSLRVHDAAGRLIRTLVNGVVDGGEHRVDWNGRLDSGQVAGSGVYFYSIEGFGTRETRRMTLLK